MKFVRPWLALVAACGLTATGATAESVRWNVERSILQGNGCQKDWDAFISSNGNDLSIVFTNLGLDLPGGSRLPLAGRKNCAVRVPAEISQGYYIGQLVQRITYGVTKTARSTGSMATRSTFFGYNVSPYTVTLPYGRAMNSPLAVQSRVDNFQVNTDWASGWCRPGRNPAGLYQANIAVSGQRDSDREDLIMFVDGLDLKFEMLVALTHCRV
jgi:hypothetical protein